MSGSKDKPLLVRIRRQDGPGELDSRRWETFELDGGDEVTVADVLRRIAREPRTSAGRLVTPVVWDDGCQWPACGICTMIINGRARPACTTSVTEVLAKAKALVLQPLETFPLRRDLWVDRARMALDATQLHAWLPPDALDSVSDGVPNANLAERQIFGRCTRCGACLEACPETHPAAAFVGPAALGLSHAAQLARPDPRRVSALLGRGGIGDCGNAGNCVEICPEAIPLDDALGGAAHAATRHWLRSLFGRKS